MRSSELAKLIFILIAFVLFASMYSCGKPVGLGNAGAKAEGTVVTISLPKKTYKMYEPILLEYEWINYKDKPDSIYALSTFSEYIEQHITDDNGKELPVRQVLDEADHNLTRIINKNDTLHSVVDLCDYGKRLEYKLQYFLPAAFGYLPAGKYSAYSLIKHDAHNIIYDPPIKTNTIEFEVTQISPEEDSLLWNARRREFAEAYQKDDDNYFNEHIMYWEVTEQYFLSLSGELEYNTAHRTKTANMYSKFIEKYPNSLYCMQRQFIIPYLQMASNDSSNDHIEMDRFTKKYPNTAIAKGIAEIIKTEKVLRWSIVYRKRANKPQE